MRATVMAPQSCCDPGRQGQPRRRRVPVPVAVSLHSLKDPGPGSEGIYICASIRPCKTPGWWWPQPLICGHLFEQTWVLRTQQRLPPVQMFPNLSWPRATAPRVPPLSAASSRPLGAPLAGEEPRHSRREPGSACPDPGVTGGHSCSDSLCKHPLPAGPPPPPAGQRAPWAPRPGPRGLPTGSSTTPRTALGPWLWVTPPGQPEARRGSRLCQGFLGKTLVGSVSLPGPGRGLAVASRFKKGSRLCFLLHSHPGAVPSPPQAGPASGAHPHPRPPPLQPCFPHADP